MCLDKGVFLLVCYIIAMSECMHEREREAHTLG